MRVVLYTEGEFDDVAQGAVIRSWAQRYARELEKKGLNVSFFDRIAPGLVRTDVVHVFGTAKPENWYWLKKRAQAVIVSPLPGEESKPPPLAHLFHFARRLASGGQPVLDLISFYRAVDAFKPFTPAEEAGSVASRIFPTYANFNRAP